MVFRFRPFQAAWDKSDFWPRKFWFLQGKHHIFFILTPFENVVESSHRYFLKTTSPRNEASHFHLCRSDMLLLVQGPSQRCDLHTLYHKLQEIIHNGDFYVVLGSDG